LPGCGNPASHRLRLVHAEFGQRQLRASTKPLGVDSFDVTVPWRTSPTRPRPPYGTLAERHASLGLRPRMSRDDTAPSR
jgi:hypothetical protein